MAFEDAEKLGFTLGCLSARAHDVAQVALPAATQTFTALHLVQLLRQDLAADGALDGRERLVPARIELGAGPVELAAEPWRAGLVAGCARWQAHPGNGMGLDDAEIARHLAQVAANTDPLLFDPLVAPPPFDEAPPTLTALAIPFEVDGQLAGDPNLQPVGAPAPADPRKRLVVSGWIRIQVDLEDPLGVTAVHAEIEGEAAEPGFGALAPRVDVLSPTHTRLEANIDTDDLEEREQILLVTAQDLLGHTVTARYSFRVDRSPPVLQAELPGVRAGDRWHTRAQGGVEAHLTWQDASPVSVRWTVNGTDYLALQPPPAQTEAVASLPLERYEQGAFAMTAVVTDVLGREARVDGTLVVDRTPPALTVAASQTVDGLDLPPDGDVEAVEPLELGPDGGLVRRWQTHWRPGAGPAAEVAFHAQDNAEGTPVEQLQITWDWCWADADGACLEGVLAPRTPLAGTRLPFTAGPDPDDPDAPAGWLGFNPLEGPAPHAFVALTAAITDLAGNSSTLPTRPVYRIEVVPPPPVVELWQTPPDDLDVQAIAPDVVVFDELRFEDGSVSEVFRHADPVQVTEFAGRLANPHGVEVEVHLRPSGPPRLQSQLVERIQSGRPVHVAEGPRCAGQRPFIGAPTCDVVGGLEGSLDCSVASCIERAAPTVDPMDEGPQHRSVHVRAAVGDYEVEDDLLRLAPHSSVELVATSDFRVPLDPLHGALPRDGEAEIYSARLVFPDAVGPAPAFPPPPAGRAFLRGPLFEGVTELTWLAPLEAMVGVSVSFAATEWHHTAHQLESQILRNTTFR